MSIVNILQLIQLRAEVARARAMEEWESGPTVYGDDCPFCHSTNYAKYSVENGVQRYRCRSCRRRFNQRRVFTCPCREPGQNPTQCHTCPKFNAFLETFKQQTEKLQDLELAELEALQQQEGQDQPN